MGVEEAAKEIAKKYVLVTPYGEVKKQEEEFEKGKKEIVKIICDNLLDSKKVYPELVARAEIVMKQAHASDLIKDLLKALDAELRDIDMMCDTCNQVFSHVTGGMISKPNTHASAINSEFDGYVEKLETEAAEEAVKDAREEWEAENGS